MPIDLNLNIEILFKMGLFFLIGYMGGWLFKAESHLRQRYGLILTFLILYFALWIQVGAGIFLSAYQSWLMTTPYVIGFIYRFFYRYG